MFLMTLKRVLLLEWLLFCLFARFPADLCCRWASRTTSKTTRRSVQTLQIITLTISIQLCSQYQILYKQQESQTPAGQMLQSLFVQSNSIFDLVLWKASQSLLQQMYQRQSIPAFGKLYLLTSIVLSLLVFTKSINPYSISYSFKQTIFEFELWRPFTAILYLSRLNILLPIHLVFAYAALKKWKEKLAHSEDKAAIIWIFLLSAIFLTIFSTFTGLYFYGNSFLMILLMMWAIQHPNDYLQVWLYHLNSIYFPLIYSATMILLGSSFKNYVAGFLIGMLLGVIKNPTFIAQHGDLLPIPNFIKASFPPTTYQNVYLPQQANEVAASQPRRRGEYFSGVGYQIG